MRMIFRIVFFAGITATHADEPVSFYREVMPILRVNCISCHKPGKLKGDLDLTTHAALVTGKIINLTDPKASDLIKCVSGEEPEMPKDGEALLPTEIDLLTRWISQGAKEDSVVNHTTQRPSQPPIYASLPAVHALAFSPDGSLLAVPGRHEILLHKADGSAIEARLAGDSPRLESVAFSKDGSLLVASGGAVSEFGEIQVWNFAKRELIRSIKISNDALFGVSISPDNQRVAVGCADKMVRVFTIADGKEVMRCDNHLDWVFGTTFSNDGQQLATVSRDKAAKLIDISTGQLIDDINISRDPLICLTRHPKDDFVATGGAEGKIRFFKMQPRGGRLSEGDNKENSFIREFEHMASPIHTISFSADGALIACGSESGEVRIFKTENGQRIAQIKGERGPTFAIAFSMDGKQLAVGGQDGRIRFHDSEKGGVLKEIDAVPLSPK